MLEKIEGWIDATLSSHLHKRVPCDVLAAHFEGFYPREFLSSSYYVVADRIPMPDFAVHRQTEYLFGQLARRSQPP